jgi:Integrase core domain
MHSRCSVGKLGSRRPTRADRALLAALSRSLPRVAWADFPVEPETLMRSAMSTLPLPPTRPRHEIHPAFDEVFRTETIRVIPHADPGAAERHAERWVRTLRADCLDRILIVGRRHLEHVLRVCRRHFNEHRPHRALDLLPPSGRSPTPSTHSIGYSVGLSSADSSMNPGPRESTNPTRGAGQDEHEVLHRLGISQV